MTLQRSDPKPAVLYVGKRGDPDLEALLADMNDDLAAVGVRNFKADELTRLRKTDGPAYAIPDRAFWPRLIRTALVVQGWRDEIGEPIVVYNGFRPTDYNRAVGGGKYSAHQWAEALDTYVRGDKDRYALIAARAYVERGRALRMGLGVYTDLEVHVDTGWVHRKWKLAGRYVQRARSVA